MEQTYRLGADIGGTFTDISLVREEDGRVYTLKVPTTHSDPSGAVFQGIDEICRRNRIEVTALQYFVHGTTLATNTIIERSGTPTGLLVTRGFRDILEIGRLRLPDTTNFYGDKPKPLIPRKWVMEISERMLANGRVYKDIELDEVRTAVRHLVAQGVQAIAVCFLHCYKNPEHERRAVALIRQEFPALFVSVSHEVLSQQREYERALVTVFNSYIGRRMERYLTGLQGGLNTRGITSKFFVTRSNGGTMTTESASRLPVATLLSGPASGVAGAAYLGKLAGYDRLITLDMGGTSADVAVVNREVEHSTENQVGDFPVIMTAVDISSIGAGGGSIAWVDSARVLKVGPQSAGSEPGPACYGRGGDEPAVTDAYLMLGLIDPARFLGGEMILQPDLARRALERLSDQLDLDLITTAESIIEVTTAKMYAQFTPLMARKGFDPRDFSLMAYGGAGPTHAFMLAREVGVGRVIVPPSPGTLCALGATIADIRSDFVKTVFRNTKEASAEQLEAEFQALEADARDWIRSEVGERGAIPEYYLLRTADMRYLGQAFEINVQLPSLISSLGEVLSAFHDRYRAIYGYVDTEAPVELVNVRCTIVGVVTKPALQWNREDRSMPVGGSSKTREIKYDGKRWTAHVFQRSELKEGAQFEGPAIVEQYDTTTFAPHGFSITVDRYHNLIGERL